MRKRLLAVAFLALAPPALGQDFKMMQLAERIGALLAAEEMCGMTYDKEALASMIDKKVPADDLGFAPNLRGQTNLAKVLQKNMTKSERAVHCRLVRRTAVHYGLVAK